LKVADGNENVIFQKNYAVLSGELCSVKVRLTIAVEPEAVLFFLGSIP